MKCPNCGNEMVQSRAGWLCMSCGHIERKTDSTAPAITLGKDAHDQLRAAANDAETKSDAPAGVAAAVTSDTPIADTTIAPAVVAPPWEPPAKPDETAAASDDGAAVPAAPTDDVVVAAVTDAPATGDAPTAADLNAVEKAVEEVQHTLGSEEPHTKEESEPAEDAKLAAESKEDANDEAESDEPEDKVSEEPDETAKAGESSSETDKADTTDNKEAESEVEPEDGDAVKESPAVVLPVNKRRMKSDDDDTVKDDVEPKEDSKADDKPDADHADDNEPEASEDTDDDKLELVEKSESAADEDKPEGPKTDEAEKEEGLDDDIKADKASDKDKSDAAKPDEKADSDNVEKEAEAPGSDQDAEPNEDDAKSADEVAKAGDEEDDHDADNTNDADDVKPEVEQPQDEIDPEDTLPESLEQVEKDIEKDDEAKAEDANAEEAAGKPKSDTAEAEKTPEAPTPSEVVAEAKGDEAKVAPPVPVYDTAPAASDDDKLEPANAPAPAPLPAPSTLQSAPTKLNSVAAHTHPAPWSLGKTISLIVGLVVVAVVAFFVYLFDFSAAGALGGYFQKMATSSSMTFNATVSYSNGDNSLAFNSQGIADTSQSKYSIKVAGQVSADTGAISSSSKAAAGSLAGTLTVIGHTLYFNQSSSKVINELLPVTVADSTWYQYDLGQDTAQCLTPSHNPLLGGGLGSAAPITGASLVGLESVDGEKMLHYRGTIETTKFLADLQKANANVPSACRFNVSSADLQNMAITFDLWRGTSHDRFVVYANNTKVGSHTELTIDTTGYNQDVSITAPSSATTVTTNPKGVLGTETVKPAASPATDAAAANAQRQSALAQYATAYAATAQNGYFFTNPPQVNVSASDPSTGQAYLIQTTTPTGLGQIDYAAGRQCDGQSITPGKLATRHVALYMLMQGAATPVCLDVK